MYVLGQHSEYPQKHVRFKKKNKYTMIYVWPQPTEDFTLHMKLKSYFDL